MRRSIPETRHYVLLIALLLAVILLIYHHFVSNLGYFPEAWNIGLREPVDELNIWIIKNKNTHAIFTYFFDPISSAIEFTLRQIEDFLIGLPWITVVMATFLLAQRIANLRIGLLSVGCLLLMGMFDLWEESMETMALMVLSVIIALLIGIPLGILTSRNDRFEAVLRPVLDGMQTMPAFVYLIPMLLLFGVARVPSVVSTVIYALPPAVRLTNLGIRGVPDDTKEAARAFGSTRQQILFKVEIPMALPTIMAGVNQTIMMALGMVVIASLIGAAGLGKEVLFALRRLRVGVALEAGLAIVSMAILLDRVSYAFSEIEHRSKASWQGFRLLPERVRGFAPAHTIESVIDFPYKLGGQINQQITAMAPDSVRPATQRLIYWLWSLIFLVILSYGFLNAGAGAFPESWQFSIREPVDDAVKWAQVNLYRIGDSPIGTGPFSDFVTIYMLKPLRDFFQDWLAWPVIFLSVTALAFYVAGWRLGVVCLISMLVIGLLGEWEFAMDTFSQVLVAVFFSILIGIPLGILASRYDTLENILRPFLDFLQTIPAFVYLVPVIMLFNLGRVPGIMASVLYSLPPVVRLTSLGIRNVDKAAIEAAQSFGSVPMQTLLKVQLPLAAPAIMMGINQTMMMVLAMVIIAGLVGGAGLGFEVVSGLAQNQPGRALEAGLAIVLMAIILDRITQAWAQQRKEATHQA